MILPPPTHSLSRRDKICAIFILQGFLTDIYLSNIFSYQKTYHLVEPILEDNFFSSASARCSVTKILLQSRAFYRKCIFCSHESKDIFSHHLFLCPQQEDARRLLRRKLVLYNFPADKLSNKKIFFGTVLSKKIWTNCFSEYLADMDSRNNDSRDQVRDINAEL